jgi:hypothetical protein
MVEYKNTGRKDTGRTDKYSDENPRKDYADYRKDYPNDNKEPRKIAKDITDGKIPPRFIGPKSIEVKKQELIAHLQNFQETFNSVQFNNWKSQAEHLLNQINIS